MVTRGRLDPEIFNLPVAKMRAGYYSDKYFVRAREILLVKQERERENQSVSGNRDRLIIPNDSPCRAEPIANSPIANSSGVIYRTAALRSNSILATVEVRMDGDLRDVRTRPEPPALWPDELSDPVLSLLLLSKFPSSSSRWERA